MANSGTYNHTKIHFAEGAAPATPDAGEWVVYAKTDGMYVKDDAGVEYGPFGSGDAAAHIADASDAHDASAISVLDTAANFAGTDVEAVLAELQDNIDAGGGGAGWTLAVDNALTALTGFTSLSGTWAADAGGFIKQTDTTAAVRRIKYDTPLRLAHAVVQVQVRFPAGSANPRTGGFVVFDGSTQGGLDVRLNRDTANLLEVQRDAEAAAADESITMVDDTWYTLRGHVVGDTCEAFFDGTYKCSGHANIGNKDLGFLGLRSFDGQVDFRNLKVWTLDLPA